ncbi:hypothetical protein [Chryseobacterium sp.]|uniref:hypothetical protein n=1 Tax=Chryseobacterium sp. TaxID=1871047 RepID=UPI002FC9F552
MKNKIKFLILMFIVIYSNAFSQINKENNCFSINLLIDSFINNLIDKEANLNENYLIIKSLKDKDGNYNIDFALSIGNLDTLKVTSSEKEMKLRYGNIKILLIGKTNEDLIFLKKSIKKTKNIFSNKDISKNNTNFYDEDYVWSTFFDNKKELINFYIPEEKEVAYKIFNSLKNKINISPKFKTLDCSCW